MGGDSISIKSARLAKGITQKDLAERMGIDQSAIAHWETGKTKPRFYRIREMAAVLECPVEELLTEDDGDGR